MQPTRRPEAGFTLIEILVVVALVGILAAIALPSFAAESRKAKGDTEVAAFFGELKVRQEQYAVEHGQYLSTGAGESALFPATPSATAQALGTLPATWQALKVRTPQSSARCGYVAIAGTWTDSAGTTAATTFGYTAPARNWFYLLARCDLDGDAAVDSFYFLSNDSSKIQKADHGR